MTVLPHLAYDIEGAVRTGRWVVMCDHATNHVPHTVADGDLGLPPGDMARHIAYDPGAAGVARALARALNAAAIFAGFSRLVIDPNRGEDDPTLLMRLYDGSIIPANRAADSGEIERRLNLFYRPYHRALATLIQGRVEPPVLVSIHSFAPNLRGRSPRPWHVGVLYAADNRLAAPLLARLKATPDLCVGDNQPYSGHLPGDTLDRHGVQGGHPHVLIELRNDLIAASTQQEIWGTRLAGMLDAALEDAQV